MPNTIIAQPLPAVTIRNPLTDLPVAPDRAPARSNDIIKALQIIELGHMEFCLDSTGRPTMARYESRSVGREGKEYWVSSEGCDCKWGRKRNEFGLGHTCKHYVALRLAQFSMTQAICYLHCERMATAFEQTLNEQLTTLAKLLRMSARLQQDIADSLVQDTGYPMPAGFPCHLCGEHLKDEACSFCGEQYKFYRIAALVKLCDCGNKALENLDCCKECMKIAMKAQEPVKTQKPVKLLDPFGDTSEMNRKIEARRAARKKPNPTQAQIEAEQQVDEFFSEPRTLQDDINLLFDSSQPQPVERITNAVREASPTVRKRHSRYKK